MADSIGQDVMNVPLGELIRSVAMAVADAQFALDKSTIIMAEFMSGSHVLRDPNDGMPILDKNDKPQIQSSLISFGHTYANDGTPIAQEVSMFELGFVPNFYQFVDTVIDIKLALRINKSTNSVGHVVTSTPVDATYASSYNYSADMACVVKTKLVPIPPPAAFEERLRLLLDTNNRNGDDAPGAPAVLEGEIDE